LIAHEGQQGRNQQRWSCAALAQKLRRNEVNKALTPTGFLYDEQASTAFDDVADCLFLMLTEGGFRMSRSYAQKL